MKKVLSILAILTFSLSMFAQGIRPISRNTKDFTDMLREAIGKETGQRAAAIKFLPVSCEDSYFNLDQGKRIRSNIEKSATMKSLFDYDPADSSALVIQVCAETLAQGLTDIGFGGSGGGNDVFATGMTVAGTKTKMITIAMSDGTSFSASFNDIDTQLSEADILSMGFVQNFVEVDGDPTNELETSTCPVGQISVSDGLGGFTCEEKEEECTIQVIETAHGITYTELTPIWYTGGTYVGNLPTGADTFPPVGLLKSVIDANTLELVRCGFEKTTYSDGYYYANNTGVSATPTQDNETPIFIAHDGTASINVDHVYGSGGGNTDIVTRTKTIDSLSQESYVFCDSVFVNGVFDFVYCDTLTENCIKFSDPFIVDAAKVLSNATQFTNMRMNGIDVEWNTLNSSTSSAPGELTMNGTSSANSATSMTTGVFEFEIASVGGAGMAASIGLSNVDNSVLRNTADFDIYFGVNTNKIIIYENGNDIYNPNTNNEYLVGDVFSIEITETAIIFRKNRAGTITELTRIEGLAFSEECLSRTDMFKKTLEEARKVNQTISLTHTASSAQTTQTISENLFVVPAEFSGATFTATYASNDPLHTGGANFESSISVYRAGSLASSEASIGIGAGSTYFSTGTSSFQVQEGDVLRVSVDQLSAVAPFGFSASINFKK